MSNYLKQLPSTPFRLNWFLGICLILSISFKASFALGWDDSDYLRMISCNQNALSSLNLVQFLHCQASLYKAPIFINLFILPSWIGQHIIHIGDLIGIQSVVFCCVFLTLICIALSLRILVRLNSITNKTIFTSIVVLASIHFNYLFMTDFFLALLTLNISFDFLYLLRLIRNSPKLHLKKLLFLSSMICIALGTKFSAAPLLLYIPILLFQIFLRTRMDRKQKIKSTVALFSPLIVFASLTLTLWKISLNTGFQMFIGLQAKYYTLWFGHGFANIWYQIHQYYLVSIFFIFYGAILLFIKRKIHVMSVEILCLSLPFLAGLILYFISKTQDPRLLLNLFLPLSLVPFFVMEDTQGSDFEIGRPRFHRIKAFGVLFIIIGISSFELYSGQDFGLRDAESIYTRIPLAGGICPLTDSANVNVSKILLIDELNKGKKSLSYRLINVPDFSMNGENSSAALRRIQHDCRFIYREKGIVSGSYKNEFLVEYTEWLKTLQIGHETNSSILYEN
jgi:hypothetical protein